MWVKDEKDSNKSVSSKFKAHTTPPPPKKKTHSFLLESLNRSRQSRLENNHGIYIKKKLLQEENLVIIGTNEK